MNTSRRTFVASVAVASVSAACAARAPAELSATEIMARASDALKKVSSAHFKLTSTGGMMAIGTGFAARSIEGDVVRPDRLKGTAVSTFGKLTVDIGFMIVGSHEYITNPISKQWEELPTAPTAPNLLDPDHGAAALLEQVTHLQKATNETVTGVDCYHVTGKIGAALIAGLAGAPGTANALAGDLWVGTKDFLVRQIRLVGPVTSTEPPQIVRVLALSSFDETVAIEPPV